MSNIMAAIGIAQIERIEFFKQKRQEIVRKYIAELKEVGSISFLNFNYNEIIPHIFVIKAKNRDKLREYLLSCDIECGIHYKPNHLLNKFSSGYSLPKTESIYEEIISIPCHYDLAYDEQDFVIQKIKEFYE